VKASSKNGALCTLLSLDPPEVEIICKMCFREFLTFKFFKISGISQKGYMVFIPFSCSLDNFQYLIVCNVPFLLDVFLNSAAEAEEFGHSQPLIILRATTNSKMLLCVCEQPVLFKFQHALHTLFISLKNCKAEPPCHANPNLLEFSTICSHTS